MGLVWFQVGKTGGVFEICVASLQVFGKSVYNTISYSFLNAQPESQVGARCWGSGVRQWGKHWTCILQTWGQDPALLLLYNKEFVWSCPRFLGWNF